MFLKSVELFGFKSFADRTRFEFSDGITSLLGPNGSGKSNVVDSIKWVLGTQALSAIRAGKRDDVIFNGTDTRKPMPMCEVILTLNNEEGLLNFNATEVEIKRRMYRTGENEYYINREKCLLKNVKDLFMDTGIGKAAYSILEQGKIAQILSLKPEDRRYILEEAAGISRFKQQSDEAQRRLEKTDENMAQAQIYLNEAEKTYNRTKGQVERLIARRELDKRKESIEVDLKLSTVQSLTKLQDFKRQELENFEKEQLEIEGLLASKRSGLEQIQKELSLLRDRREELSSQIHRNDERCLSIDNELSYLDENFRDMSQRARDAKVRADQMQDRLDHDRQVLEDRRGLLDEMLENLNITVKSIENAQNEIEMLKTEKIKHQLDIGDLEEANDELSRERLEITKQISDLANDIADRLEENIQGSGYSTVARKAAEKEFFKELSKASTILKERLAFLRQLSSMDGEKDDLLKAIDDADEDLRSELDEIKGLFQEYSGSIPTFLDEFTSPEGTLARKTELDASLQKSYQTEEANKAKMESLSDEIQRLERLLLLKDSNLQDLKLEQVQLRTKAESLKAQISDLKASLQQMEFDFTDASHSIEAEQDKVNQILEKIDDAKNRKLEMRQAIDQLREEVSNLNIQIEQKSQEIDAQNSQFTDKFQRKQELIGIVATSKANLEALGEMIQKEFTDFFDSTGKSLKEFNDHEITAKVEDLKAELETIKHKIEGLGYPNYMAEDEFNEAKKNYDFYSKNLEDLTKAKTDLEEVIAEIRRKSEELFLSTYQQISENFQQMFTLLFGGGRAQLSLTDEENVLESGIEIVAQPPGKKLTHLPLLSGGEQSMTAVALLFATYKVKPSPFCILDEIDAALDARNIGAFLKVLEQFGDKSQFIIITHNKHTVMGSNSLLGITQQELGVSKLIGYRLEEVEDLTKSHDVLK